MQAFRDETRAGGEPHTFLDSSPDYVHFVIQTPGVRGEEARAERVAITHADLGL